MVALTGGFFGFGRRSSERATALAFKVGEKVHKKKGVSPKLREAVLLYRESQKTER